MFRFGVGLMAQFPDERSSVKTDRLLSSQILLAFCRKNRKRPTKLLASQHAALYSVGNLSNIATHHMTESASSAPADLRSTYAKLDELTYRLRSVSALLGITDRVVRAYEEASGVSIKRANETNPASPPARVFDPFSLFEIAQWRRTSGAVKTPESGPIIISTYVVKGGTAKTTTAVETAVHLQAQGLRVLLIDIDVQANATQILGYEPDLTEDEAPDYGVSSDAIVRDTLASYLVPYIEALNKNSGTLNLSSTVTRAIKKPFGEAGPHLLPGDAFVSDVEPALFQAKGQRELMIRRLIEASRSGGLPGFDARNYDVIIFDCPPSVSLTSAAALAASDFVIAPIRLDSFSVKGLAKLMSELSVLERNYQLKPEIIILPTFYEPTIARINRMHKQLSTYRDLLAPCVISSSEDFPRSLSSYLPLSLQKPTSSASKEYSIFAGYLFEKILSKGAEKARKVSE